MATTKNTDRIGVFIAAEAGVRPTLADYDPYTQAVSWSVVAGSGLWQATLVPNLAGQNRRIKDKEITAGGNRQVEIWKLSDDLNVESDDSAFQDRLLFWGEMLGYHGTIEDSGEREVYGAAIRPYHFGVPVGGQKVKYAGTVYTVPIPLEFQPMIDGKVVDNRFKPTGHSAYSYYWIDPESVRTDSAKTFQDGTVEAWTVGTAVESLLMHFNESETFIANAKHSTGTDVVKGIEELFASAPVVKNLVLNFGEYLPQYLDAICNRYGFGWVVDCTKVSFFDSESHQDENFPCIRFFKQQEGTEQTVKMQAPGAVLDLDSTNMHALDLQSDLGNLQNIIRGYGALIEREFTIPLYRTWENTDDNNYSHSNTHNPIGRKWAANEAGDYNGIRAEIPDVPPNFGTGWIPKRRVIEDCITLRDDKRRPPLLEYREDEDSSWKEVPNEWGYRILHDELGIWWTGIRQEESTNGGIPEELLTDEVQLRITGVVRGDTRIEYTTPTSVYSPNSNEIMQTIDLSDRFFDRRRQDTGTYASILTGPMDSVYNYSDLVAHIGDAWGKSDLADTQATVTLIGLHYCYDADGNTESYRIGDMVTKVEGREISFNRAAEGNAGKTLQITGIRWINEPGNQSTILELSPTGVT